jgi:hypothetical protein
MSDITATGVNLSQYTTSIVMYNSLKLDLEQKLLNLRRKEANGTATSEDIIFIKSLEAKLSELMLNPPSPLETKVTLSSSKETLADSGAATVNNLSQQQAMVEQLAKIPTPEKNNVGQIRYTEIDPDNLVDYINATQHLNPWGRERQCDKDLKNLMLIINGDMRHQMGKIQETVKQLDSLS